MLYHTSVFYNYAVTFVIRLPSVRRRVGPEVTAAAAAAKEAGARGVSNFEQRNLVYNIDIDEKNNVLITMTLTTPNCPEAETIPDRVAEAVSKCDDVGDVRVEIVWEPTWTQDNMSEAARLELGFF